MVFILFEVGASLERLLPPIVEPKPTARHLTIIDTDLTPTWVSESPSPNRSKSLSINSREAIASEMGDPGAKTTEKGGGPTSKEGKSAKGTLPCI